MQIEEIGLEIHDVVNGEAGRLDDLVDLYLELFPEYARYIPIMRRRAFQPIDVDKSVVVHQWLVTIHNKAAGMVVFKYNVNRNCGIGLDLAVRKEFKRIKYKEYDRLAQLLIHLRQVQIKKDAFANGRQTVPGVVIEVESRKVLEVFKKYGMIELNIKYHEPPAPESVKPLIDTLSLTKVNYKPMYLGVYPIDADSFNVQKTEVQKEFIQALLIDHYELSADHWVVVDALKSISKDI
jgi:hypothetical protein